VWARFSVPVQTGPEAHPASCTNGTGSFPGVRCDRGVTLTPQPLLVPKSKINHTYNPTLRKGLVDCERVKPTHIALLIDEGMSVELWWDDTDGENCIY